jgi:hypothetical protein
MKFEIDWTLELLLKVAALILAMGIMIGKLNAIDTRVQRIENFVDSHVVIRVEDRMQ